MDVSPGEWVEGEDNSAVQFACQPDFPVFSASVGKFATLWRSALPKSVTFRPLGPTFVVSTRPSVQRHHLPCRQRLDAVARVERGDLGHHGGHLPRFDMGDVDLDALGQLGQL